ncbi:vitellogenin-like [Bacillus rossius redtenbacheri]|uniref:vitellogenin-like n=1 Tax=Bacillus rossius redtenbacheri TaxID=93214 RepID=UPI002FDE0772
MGGGDGRSWQLSLALLVLSGWTLQEGHGWRARQEYVYRLEGRTVAGFLSLDSFGVGLHYLAKARLQAASDTVLLLKVEDAWYTRLHEDMADSWWQRAERPGEDWQPLPVSGTTAVVTHEDGVVRSVAHSPELPEWEVNFLQGIAGHLQADLSRGVDLAGPELPGAHSRRRKTPATAVYKVMENGVAGRCEVLYEVAKVSRAHAALGSDWPDGAGAGGACGGRGLLELTKTTNYSRCERGAEYHVGLPASAADCNAGSNLCGDYWQRVFVTRMRGCGDLKDFTVLDSVGTSRQLANLHLHGDSGAAVSSYLNLSLVSAGPVESFLPTVSHPSVQRNLVYLFRPQELEGERAERVARQARPPRAKPHHEVQRPKTAPVMPDAASSEEEEEKGGDAGLPPPDANNPPQLKYCPQFLSRKAPEAERRSRLVSDFRATVLEVAAEMDDPQQLLGKMTLERLEGAAVTCRSLTRSELQTAIGDLLDQPEGHSHTERKLAMDVLAMCGTHPSFRLLKELVESERIGADSAADVLSSVPHHLSAPTQSLLEEFGDLLSSAAVKKDQQLLISTALAFSNLVRAACANPRTRRARYTAEVLGGDECSRAHADAHLRRLVAVARQHPGLQSAMLTALGNTALPGALPVLASVAAGDSSAYVRAIAVFSMRHHALLRPAETLPVLLGVFQRQENPAAVRMAAVALLWHSGAPLAVWQRLAIATWYERDPAIVAFVASSLSSFASTDSPGWEQMKRNAQAVLRLAKPSPTGQERAYNLIWSAISQKLNSIVVQQLEWIHNSKFSTWYYHSASRLGGFSWFDGEAELDVANPEALLASLRELVAPSEDAALSRPPLGDLPRATRRVAEQLGVSLKAVPALEGLLRFKQGGLAERLLPFGKKLRAELARAGGNLASQMKQGKDFHFQKVDMRMFMIETATEMGFPVSFKLSVPTASRLSGRAMLSEDSTHVAFDVSAFHARHLLGELMVYTAWDRQLHVAGSHGCSIAAPPELRVNARFDPAASLLQLEVKQPGGGGASFHHRAAPYLAQRDASDNSLTGRVKMVRADRPKKVDYRDKKLSLSFESDDPRGFVELCENSMSVLGFPMFPDLRASSMHLQLAELPPVVATFGLGTATANKGEISIWRAPLQGRQWPKDILGGDSGPEMATSDVSDGEEGPWETTTPPAQTEGQEGSSQSTGKLRSWDEVAADSSEEWEECYEEDGEPEQRPSFNAKSLLPHGPAVNGTSYLLRETLKDLYYGRAFVVSANISVNSPASRIYSAFLVQASRPLGLEHRLGLFVKEVTSDWQMTLGYQARNPLMPIFNIDEKILSNLSSVVYSDLELVVHDTKYTISFSGEADHRTGTPVSLSNSWRQEGCHPEECNEGPAFNKKCRKILHKSTTYDFFSGTLVYNEEVKEFLPAYSPWHEEALPSLEPYLAEEQETARAGRGEERLSVTAYVADDRREMDLVVVAPGCKRLYRGVPAPFAGDDRIVGIPRGGAFRPPTCILGKNRIATYDGVEYEYGVNGCWHVVTMDCSGENQVAIFARRKGDDMELELNADNYKIISVLPGPEVFINDEQINFDQRNVTQVEDDKQAVFAEMSLSPDDSLRIDLLAYGLRVLYDKSAAIIESTPRLDGRMCGLCGDQDGDLADEFAGPGGRVLATAGDFGRSFLLRDSECEPASRPERPGRC